MHFLAPEQVADFMLYEFPPGEPFRPFDLMVKHGIRKDLMLGALELLLDSGGLSRYAGNVEDGVA